MKGWPDYTRVTGLVDNYDEYAQNYPVGIGDGAARLGSIKTYDMRGRVWWLDDLEAAVLHWPVVGMGIGGAQGLVTDYVRNGNQAIGLTSNTGAGRRSMAWRYLQLPPAATEGIEFHVSNALNFGELETTIMLDDGTNFCYASIRLLEGPPQRLEYMTPAGWADTGINIVLSNFLSHFHALKLVFDYTTDEWLRIMWDDQVANLNRAAMHAPGGGIRPLMYIAFDNVGDNMTNTRVIIDDIIVTTMEPE